MCSANGSFSITTELFGTFVYSNTKVPDGLILNERNISSQIFSLQLQNLNYIWLACLLLSFLAYLLPHVCYMSHDVLFYTLPTNYCFVLLSYFHFIKFSIIDNSIKKKRNNNLIFFKFCMK